MFVPHQENMGKNFNTKKANKSSEAFMANQLCRVAIKNQRFKGQLNPHHQESGMSAEPKMSRTYTYLDWLLLDSAANVASAQCHMPLSAWPCFPLVHL
jgi:hypothetical protein